MKEKVMIAAVLLALPAAPTAANWAPGDAPFINTWLVLGTYDNREGAGMRTDLIGEATVQPRAGEQVAGKTWQFFDDRIFSRNYDDYQDLFSYFFVRQDEPRNGRMASMFPGVRPSIILASSPTAWTIFLPLRVVIATTEGSFRTMPRPLT